MPLLTGGFRHAPFVHLIIHALRSTRSFVSSGNPWDLMLSRCWQPSRLQAAEVIYGSRGSATTHGGSRLLELGTTMRRRLSPSRLLRSP